MGKGHFQCPLQVYKFGKFEANIRLERKMSDKLTSEKEVESIRSI